MKKVLLGAMCAVVLATSACSERTEQAAANGNPQAAADSAGQDIKQNTAESAAMVEQAGQNVAEAAQTGTMVATGAAMNTGEAIASVSTAATAATADAVATGAQNVAQGAENVADNAAAAHAEHQAVTDPNQNPNLVPEKQNY